MFPPRLMTPSHSNQNRLSLFLMLLMLQLLLLFKGERFIAGIANSCRSCGSLLLYMWRGQQQRIHHHHLLLLLLFELLREKQLFPQLLELLLLERDALAELPVLGAQLLLQALLGGAEDQQGGVAASCCSCSSCGSCCNRSA